jgi:DNA-directed RNA polymerase specialized sigma subunit
MPLDGSQYMAKVSEQLRSTIERQPDTAHKAKVVHEALTAMDGLNAELSKLRKVLFQALVDEGWTQTAIAREYGMSTQRVSQLVTLPYTYRGSRPRVTEVPEVPE